MPARPRQRPEALAQFAETARTDRRQDRPDLVAERAPYDATTDPRTGRPPLPIEAEDSNRERELQHLRNAQLTEGEEDIDLDEADIDVTLEEDILSSHDMDDDDENERN
jgi:hypothetical protein